MLIIYILLYVVAYIWIWIGSGLITRSTTVFSKKLRLSPFAFSFVFLGLLTSVPEFSVGIQAVLDHNAEIFVGNLLGGIPVLFLFVIPLLAIFGNGISLKQDMDNRTLLFTLGVILAPSLLILDKRVTNPEGIVLMLLYVALIYVVERKKGILNTENAKLFDAQAYSARDLCKIILGVVIVFFASKIIVEKTIFFAGILGISAFHISIFVVSLGTNLPELSLAVRSVMSGGKDVAVGDYLGSAAANTMLFGLFTLLHSGEVITGNNFTNTFIIILLSLIIFYIFFQKRFLTRKNGMVMLGLYVLFTIIEVAR